MLPPPTIICVDCGGTCHLLTTADRDTGSDGFDEPSGAFEDADADASHVVEVVASYRCADCLDRWDVIFDPE